MTGILVLTGLGRLMTRVFSAHLSTILLEKMNFEKYGSGLYDCPLSSLLFLLLLALLLSLFIVIV